MKKYQPLDVTQSVSACANLHPYMCLMGFPYPLFRNAEIDSMTQMIGIIHLAHSF